MRCVPINPLVEAPQMKKLPASSQKSRERKPSPSVSKAAFTALVVRGGSTGAMPIWP